MGQTWVGAIGIGLGWRPSAPLAAAQTASAPSMPGRRSGRTMMRRTREIDGRPIGARRRNRIGAGTVFHLADKASPGWRDKERAKEKAGNAVRQADILIELAAAAELFHTDDGKGYADIFVNAHRETWLIGSKGFREWLLLR